ncbi:MAG: hypothetical protein EB120_09950 [Proteobacteria bacterium]|nr:hypothetical protein [Pseudomonadota bacterium]NDG27483.1 hypothetical protein [Pseudomonadota bacterium]
MRHRFHYEIYLFSYGSTLGSKNLQRRGASACFCEKQDSVGFGLDRNRASAETRFDFRHMCSVVAGVNSLFLALPLWALTSSWMMGAVGSVLYLNLNSVRSFGFQIRPDIYVGWFSLLGLFFLLQNH